MLGCIYRSPSLSREKTTLIFQEINIAATRYKNVCIMGDFNYRNIDWVNYISDNESEELIRFVNENFLKQLVNVPTRENSVLDIILTNRDNLVSNLDVGGKLGNSDHEEIRLKNENRVLVPNFRKGKYEAFRKHLSEVCNLRIRKRAGQVAEIPGREIRDGQVRVGEESEIAGRRGVEGDYNEFVRILITG